MNESKWIGRVLSILIVGIAFVLGGLIWMLRSIKKRLENIRERVEPKERDAASSLKKKEEDINKYQPSRNVKQEPTPVVPSDGQNELLKEIKGLKEDYKLLMDEVKELRRQLEQNAAPQQTQPQPLKPSDTCIFYFGNVTSSKKITYEDATKTERHYFKAQVNGNEGRFYLLDDQLKNIKSSDLAENAIEILNLNEMTREQATRFKTEEVGRIKRTEDNGWTVISPTKIRLIK